MIPAPSACSSCAEKEAVGDISPAAFFFVTSFPDGAAPAECSPHPRSTRHWKQLLRAERTWT